MGLLLRQWRERQRLSLHELAELAGVSYVTITRIENERMSPTVAMLEKLAAALKISVREFFPVEGRRSQGRRRKGDA
jgi:transcriptional regulator with XRE-family HTH domain